MSERRVAKAAVEKPISPRSLEVNEVREVKEARDSEAELALDAVADMAADAAVVSAGERDEEFWVENGVSWSGKRGRFCRRIKKVKRNFKGTMMMTTAMNTRMLKAPATEEPPWPRKTKTMPKRPCLRTETQGVL